MLRDETFAIYRLQSVSKYLPVPLQYFFVDIVESDSEISEIMVLVAKETPQKRSALLVEATISTIIFLKDKVTTWICVRPIPDVESTWGTAYFVTYSIAGPNSDQSSSGYFNRIKKKTE